LKVLSFLNRNLSLNLFGPAWSGSGIKYTGELIMTTRQRTKAGLIAGLIGFIFLMMSAAARADGPADCANITTGKGPVTGVAGEKDVCAYKGIPFAAPPVGALRFRRPQEHAPWSAPLPADKYGSDCMQFPMSISGGKDSVMGNEDCLFLNVWAPKSAATEKKPVMIFLHGGGFVTGSGSWDTYEGTNLAARGDVVVVTINYRLGPFGFYAHPSLREPDGASEANNGLYDQVAAFKWVRDNIAAFGGDPNNVTIFGESAGGMSVGMHLISPVSRGLFQKAVIESGPVILITRRVDTMESQGLKAAGAAGCNDPAAAAACLRALPAIEIQKKMKPNVLFFSDLSSDQFPFEPAIGDALIPDNPIKLFREGKFAEGVPVMLGTNKDEASYFIAGRTLNTPEDFKNTVKQDAEKIKNYLSFNLFSDQLLALYPLDSYSNVKQAYADVVCDAAFTCPTRMLANLLAANGAKVYLYHFVKTPSNIAKSWGAFHGSELAFVFGNFTFMGIKFPSKENSILSNKMIAYWSAFARTGVPGHEKLPAWPVYEPKAEPYMELNVVPTPRSGLKTERCRLFEKLVTDAMNK
jgi:para-nitrobenzyl esterase